MRRFGLLGRSLGHSFSQGYFERKFAAEGLTGVCYQNFELADISALPGLLEQYPDLVGLNVTIPYKEAVLPYLTERDSVVASVGACNCISISDKKLTGYNTDVIGFRKAVEPALKPHHQKALVLGTGGAAKAVTYVLQQLHIAYRMVSRSPAAGELRYEDLSETLLREYTVLINTTPLGTYPDIDTAPPIPYDLLTPDHFLFDLVYNPAETRFLQLGKKQGAQTANGYQMLVEQAEAAWQIWNAV